MSSWSDHLYTFIIIISYAIVFESMLNFSIVCYLKKKSLYARLKKKRLLVYGILEEGTEAAKQKLYTVRAGTCMMQA